jgi:hypothetical protein
MFWLFDPSGAFPQRLVTPFRYLLEGKLFCVAPSSGRVLWTAGEAAVRSEQMSRKCGVLGTGVVFSICQLAFKLSVVPLF